MTVGLTYCAVGAAAASAICAFLGPAWHFTAETAWARVGDETTTVQAAWDIASDFGNYPRWNTFTTAVVSKSKATAAPLTPPQVGTPVELHVSLGQPFPLNRFVETKSNMTLDFTWLEFEPPRRFCWGIRNKVAMLDNVLHSHRCMEFREFREEDIVLVRVRNRDLNVGILAPLIEFMFREQIEAGFHVMNEDLDREIRPRFAP